MEQMKLAMPEIIIETHKTMMINSAWWGFCKFLTDETGRTGANSGRARA
ncbi:MAG: hypothetical protein MI975_07245 [Cytophagales bacterium]|nr:hypothetical protein [Cytophagales bacterium]